LQYLFYFILFNSAHADDFKHALVTETPPSGRTDQRVCGAVADLAQHRTLLLYAAHLHTHNTSLWWRPQLEHGSLVQ